MEAGWFWRAIGRSKKITRAGRNPREGNAVVVAAAAAAPTSRVNATSSAARPTTTAAVEKVPVPPEFFFEFGDVYALALEALQSAVSGGGGNPTTSK